MGGGLATGHPYYPLGDAGYDPTPLLMVLAGLLVARFLLRVRLTGAAVLFVAIAGTGLGYAADQFGVLPTASAGFLAAVILVALVRRSQVR